MNICEICGCEYDEELAEFDFRNGINIHHPLPVSYHQFGRCLCGECAVNEYEDGNYFETCESCGKKYFPEDEEDNFQQQVSRRVTGANMYENGIYCADCAAAALFAELDSPSNE